MYCVLLASFLFAALVHALPEWNAKDTSNLATKSFLVMVHSTSCGPCLQVKKWFNDAFASEMQGEEIECRLFAPEGPNSTEPPKIPPVSGYPTFVFRKKGSDSNWVVTEAVDKETIQRWAKEEAKN